MSRRWMIPAAVVVGGVAVTAAGFLALTRDGGAGPVSAATTTTAAAALAEPGAVPRTITVEAAGSVLGHPDTATVVLGVQVERPTAQEALVEAGTKARQVIDTLKAQGVAEDDLTTADLSLWPRTDNEGKEILGYTASNSVRATIRKLDDAGAIIDAAAKAAGDDVRLNGISFSIADTTGLAAQARAKAVEQARAQATQLAEAAGVALGPVAQVSTASYDIPQPQVYETAAGRDAAAAVPIQPGTQEVTARVTVVFTLG